MLRRLEKSLRQAIEGGIGGRFLGPVHPLEVARALAREMVAARQEALHETVAPNAFRVRLHPGEEGALLAVGDLLHQELYRYLADEARSRDLAWAGPVRFEFVPDPAVRRGRVAVTARIEIPPAPAPAARWERTLQAPSLEVVEGFGKGQVHTVPTPRCVLGRGEGSDIRIGDPGVSRHHAAIHWRDGCFTVEDLGSRFGTLHNGQAVSAPSELRPGDTLQVGHTTLRFLAALGLQGQNPPRDPQED